ncbi:FliH/SctL family protein [Thermosyntropha sp.]|uniref:FliH/SctL family protein n=1 Tax=Thermosyntropha sp. TaxID=2740820 RepID=UPI0025FB6EA6|nr:FliH/SctL family protein [Thermosyntropha sp.]MBO8159348.1 hypothetical protein [Thermosyntropha sp.]
MSRIIKNSKVNLTPRVINVIKVSPAEENDEFIPLNDNDINDISPEELQLEDLKNESEKIIKETEDMAMELLQKAREEAKLIIAEAQEEADTIRAQVYEEAQELRKKAEQEGYEEGIKRALEEMEEKIEKSREESEQIIEEASRLKLEIMRSVEQDIVSLALAVAKKVIMAEIKSNPAIILDVVREAISFLDQPGNITLRVNPEDMKVLNKLMEKGDFADIENEAGNVELKPDFRITQGGFIIESEKGVVDAQIETRLTSIEEAFNHEVSGE